jgi:heme/copper-type cytochrome/quinol oxidase subunit 2
MRGYVSVDSEESYDEWLSEQMTFKDLMESADLEANKFVKNN